MKAIVIGAGFGGIAAALRLRSLGYDVTLVERQEQLGGRASVFRRNGFVFDAGPTVITAPFLIEELFSLFQRKMSDYIELIPIYPWYRIRFSDGSYFNYGGTEEQMQEQVSLVSPDDLDGYKQFLKHSQAIFEIGFSKLGDTPFHSLKTLILAIPDMVRLRSYESVYKFTSRHFKNEKLRKVFSFQPLLVGGNPFSTTSIYSLIQIVERKWGIHYALGGTGAIVSGLCRLMNEAGIKIKLNSTVSEILIERNKIIGVKTNDGSTIEADLVVANADPPHVYNKMLPNLQKKKWTPDRLEKLKYSMGLFVLYFGTRKKYPQCAHHTILLGERYKELLQDIFETKRLSEDFSLYLHVPTVSDPSLAPEGCESMYVLCPVPNLQGDIDWKLKGEWLKERIVKCLSNTELPELEKYICEEFYVTPQYFEESLLSHHGSAFSIQPILTQSAYFRFHNKSKEIDGLYFVGAGTHPGAGLPGTLTSAKVMINALNEKKPRLSN